MALRDQDLLTPIQYAVVEPPDGGAAWPSGLWTRDEVLSYLNQRQNRLLKETLLIVKTASIPVALPSVGLHRFTLPTDWMRTVTLVWVGTDGQTRELVRADTFEADHGFVEWLGVGLPLIYMEFEADHLEVQIGPAPSVPGTLELLYVAEGTDLTGNGVTLTVPDDISDAVKYGTLADMLGKDGRGQDLTRARYCEDRFQLGIEAARLILEGWA